MSASEVRAAVENAFRDYRVPGLPSSGENDPDKAEIRYALGELLETTLSAIGAGFERYATLAELNANPGSADGELAYVFRNAGSTSDPANGVYQWNAAGNAWQLAPWYFNAVAGVLQPLVDEATEARDEVVGLTPRLFNGLRSLGESIGRATIAIAPQNGAVAIANGIRFSNGNGAGSFISYDVRLFDVDRQAIPVGSVLRVHAEFTVTPGAAAALGEPSTEHATKVVYRPDGVGVYHNLGVIDERASRYVAANVLARGTTVTWFDRVNGAGNPVSDGSGTAVNIYSLGGTVQFPTVPGYTGVYDVVLRSVALYVDDVPLGQYASAADFVQVLENERKRSGYVITYTVGGTASEFASLPLAQAALKDATPEAPQRVKLESGLYLDKFAVPANTYLEGGSLNMGATIISYTGSATMTGATRINYDPMLIRGSCVIRGINLTTRESNYCVHSESAGAVKNFTQLIEDCTFRHEGNPLSTAAAGTPDLNWIPAIGVGMSSGGSITLRRVTATSRDGGGLYFHNTTGQDRPCHVLVEDCVIGGDAPYAADMYLSTLGSGTNDTVTLRNTVLNTGLLGCGVSAFPSDPAKNPANHMDFRVTLENVGDFIWSQDDSGRALRIRGSVAQPNYFVQGYGTAYGAMVAPPNLAENKLGDAGIFPALIGWYDVSTSSQNFGRRLGNCATAPKSMTIQIAGSADTVINFTTDMRGVSNSQILATINAALGSKGVADLYAPGRMYHPVAPQQERVMRNVGDWGINQGTIVLLLDGGAACRCAEPEDFTGSNPTDPKARFGIALQDIYRGKVGRVQYRGWYSALAPDLYVDSQYPNVGDGYKPVVRNGIHGQLQYVGSGGGIFRCVRFQQSDGLGRSTPCILQVG